MNDQQFEAYIREQRPIHLIGIGGVSMRALARMLQHMGARVRGSDRDASRYTQELCQAGIPVTIGHHSENTAGAGLVIRTAAIPDTNPEIQAARAACIPILSRAEAWGMIMTHYRRVVCVAGTHGKTSTTAMIATFADAAAMDPTVMVGGDLPSIGGTLRIGQSDLFVAEACEYRNSFLSFHPSVAVILNIDMDHLDFFKDLDDIMRSFRQFALLTPEDGAVIINGGDEHCRQAVAGISRRVITFGLSEDCDIHPAQLTLENGYYCCDIVAFGKPFCPLRLQVPGEHNLLDALAAAAVAVELGTAPEDFAHGIQDYHGVGRRFEFKKEWRGARIYDDYAHHPSEIEATLKAARALEPRRVICVFQPHTYSRTVSLLDPFAQALSHADHVILCPIFAARETNTYGISSQDIAKRIPQAETASDLADAAARLGRLVQPGDLVFLMGAGNVNQIAELLED